MGERRALPSFANADARPRIHAWKRGNEAAWSNGPGTDMHYRPTVGAALEEAIGTVGDGAAVIIWHGIEGMPG